MSDYNISAEITANTKGFESGVKKAQTASKNLGKSITNVVKGFGKGGLTGALTSAGLALGGIGIAVGATVKAVKGLVKVLDECSEAYKVQLKAERALDTAISNSPYVTGSASKRLKEFASEMQKVSNMGDEELIPFMTQLIASGRTEAETMKIIKTASDMASSGAMSFDTAVTQLNATLNGNIGRLGQQNAELKALSEEELKNGKAVDILAEKYKGLTEATVDSKKQLKNAIGDLKESFGASFEQAMTPMRKFFTTLIQGWADARKAREEYEGARKAYEAGTATNNQLVLYYEQQLKYIADEKKMYELMYGADEEYAKAHLKELELEENKYKSLVATIKYKIKLEEEGTQGSKDAEDREQRIADLKDAYLKKIAEQEARWQNIKKITGETVKAEEKIKFYEDSLVELMTEAGGEITTNNQLYKDQMVIVERLRKTLQPVGQETSDVWTDKIRKQVLEKIELDKQVALESLDLANATEEKKYQIEKLYNEKARKIELSILEDEQEKALKSIEGVANEEAEKTRILEYYAIERAKIAKKYDLQMEVQAEESGKKIGEKFAQGLQVIQKTTKFIANEFSKALNNISKIIKGLFSGGKSIFTKLFDLNLDTALDGLLKIEDKILTFFVETLPKLPQFFASALQSIGVLLGSLLQIITPEKISDIIIQIMQTISNYAPTIIQAIGTIMTNMLQGIIDSLPQILDTMGTVVEEIAKMLPYLLQKLIDLFIKILQNPTKVVDIVKALITGFVEIVKVLARNIGPLLDALLPVLGQIIIEIIKALPNLLVSLTRAVGEAVLAIGKWVVNLIIDGINLLLDGISSVWTWIPGTSGIPHIPHFATGTDNAQRGLALVGEAGPELVNFRGGEQVLNNRNTQKALAGIGNNGNTFNVTFNNTMDTTAYAMMSQLKQYNRQMAINSII